MSTVQRPKRKKATARVHAGEQTDGDKEDEEHDVDEDVGDLEKFLDAEDPNHLPSPAAGDDALWLLGEAGGGGGGGGGKTAKRKGRRPTKTVWTEEQSWTCHLCSQQLEGLSSFIEHQKSEHNSGHGFCCPICRREDFNRKEHFVIHLETHAEAVPFVPCQHCGKMLPNGGKMQRHIKEVHEDKQHVCPVCDKKFSRRDKLKLHQLCHLPDNKKPHICGRCGKGFSRQEHVQRHELICDKIQQKRAVNRVEPGSQSSSADQHLVKLEKELDIASIVRDRLTGLYPCPFKTCSNSFKERRYISEHYARAHVSQGDVHHTCAKCHRGFKLYKDLKRHEARPHKDSYFDKKFVCSFDGCNMRFKRSTDLRLHQMIHTGERPFKCQQESCGATFTQKQSLKVHLSRVHKIVMESEVQTEAKKKAKKKLKKSNVQSDREEVKEVETITEKEDQFASLQIGDDHWEYEALLVDSEEPEQNWLSQQEEKLAHDSDKAQNKSIVMSLERSEPIRSNQHKVCNEANTIVETNFQTCMQSSQFRTSDGHTFTLSFPAAKVFDAKADLPAEQPAGGIYTDYTKIQEQMKHNVVLGQDCAKLTRKGRRELTAVDKSQLMREMSMNNVGKVCPVCGKVFKNLEGLETHILTTKLPGHTTELLPALREHKLSDEHPDDAVEEDKRQGDDKVHGDDSLARIDESLPPHQNDDCLTVDATDADDGKPDDDSTVGEHENDKAAAAAAVETDDARPNLCVDCNQSFSCEQQLLDHVLDVHKTSRAAAHSTRPRRAVKKGETTAGGGGGGKRSFLFPDYKLPPMDKTCPDCHGKFATDEAVARHLERGSHFEGGGRAVFACVEAACRLTFGSSGRLLHHMKIGKHLTPCPHCARQFEQLAKLNEHVAGHTDAGAAAVNSRRRHECRTCGKRFGDRARLVVHTRSHTGERPYLCVHCGAGFAKNEHLKRHVQNVHLKLRPVACDHCDMAFSDKYKLKAHMKKHSDDAPYLCTICAKKFKRKETLDNHMMVHSSNPNSKDFVCVQCGAKFACQAYLNRHIANHFAEKRFVCDKCPRAFVNKKDLAHHANHVHTQEKRFQCEVCQNRFKSKQSLDVHKKTYQSGECTKLRKLRDPSLKRFVCDLCDRRFFKKALLDWHYRVHTGDRPYPCTVEGCSKSFTQNQLLRAHLRHYHKLQLAPLPRGGVKRSQNNGDSTKNKARAGQSEDGGISFAPQQLAETSVDPQQMETVEPQQQQQMIVTVQCEPGGLKLMGQELVDVSVAGGRQLNILVEGQQQQVLSHQDVPGLVSGELGLAQLGRDVDYMKQDCVADRAGLADQKSEADRFETDLLWL